MMRKMMMMAMLLLMAITVGSCRDWLETSGNGKLDGNWHLTTIDSLDGGGSVDVRADRKYYAVQGKILEVHDADEGVRYIFRFSHMDGCLALSDARLNSREEDDPVVTSVAPLVPYGINSLEESFTVEFGSDGRMMLTSSLLRLTFERF